MNRTPYTAPASNLKAFTCPHCNAYAVQYKLDMYYKKGGAFSSFDQMIFKLCDHCGGGTIFYNNKMIVPITGEGPLPNDDLPEDVINDYLEAMTVINMSPRSAAALLRLALQKLCVYLGESGKNINNDIKSMVEKGLPRSIQQALDAIRLVGNQAVHPGELDLTDDVETVSNLFKLINFIGDYMITQPKEIESFYKNLPADKLKEIETRDTKK